MTDKYILEGKKVVECPHLRTWAEWYETADRHVAKTTIGGIRISTVFLGLDYRFNKEGEPLLFETIVFGGKFDLEMYRYATWEEAEKGHQKMVDKLMETK